MLPEYVRNVFLSALAGAPDVFGNLLTGVVNPATLDFRPDPNRFTIREVIAHLADLDEIFTKRLQSTLSEDTPTFESLDLDGLAAAHDYAQTDPSQQLARLRMSRAVLVETFRSVPENGWQRAGKHARAGLLTIETQLAMIGGHDGAHAAQIAQWLKLSQ